MDTSTNMIHVGYHEVPKLLLELLNDENHWSNDRSNYFGLEQTGSIPLKYNFTHPEGMIGKYSNHEKINSLTWPVIAKIGESLGNYYCSRALIAKLPPGGVVAGHIDPGHTFGLFHRYCWVISTNTKAMMRVGDMERHFALGEIWEINNKKTHSAINEGDSERLHLIFDLANIETLIAYTPKPFEHGSYDDRYFKIVLKRKEKTGKYEV